MRFEKVKHFQFPPSSKLRSYHLLNKRLVNDLCWNTLHTVYYILLGDTDAQIMPYFCTAVESLGILLKYTRHN